MPSQSGDCKTKRDCGVFYARLGYVVHLEQLSTIIRSCRRHHRMLVGKGGFPKRWRPTHRITLRYPVLSLSPLFVSIPPSERAFTASPFFLPPSIFLCSSSRNEPLTLLRRRAASPPCPLFVCPPSPPDSLFSSQLGVQESCLIYFGDHS